MNLEAIFGGLSLWANGFFFALGVVIIAGAADGFIVGAVGIAEGFRVPKVVIGATLVSLLTTAPEVTVSVVAALLRRPATAMGNAVGSVIANIGLILGTALAIRPLASDRGLLLRHGSWMLGAGLALAFFTIVWGGVTRWGALLLLAGLGTYLLHSMWVARAPQAAVMSQRAQAFEALKGIPGPRATSAGMWRLVPALVGGGLGVAAGSVLLVQNGVILARWAGVPEMVIALTLVAVGTSVPEYVTTVAAALRGHTDLGLGNIVGANVLNVLWVLGASALVHPLAFDPVARRLDLGVMLAFMALLVLLGGTRGRYERWEGFLLLGLYGGYVLARVAGGGAGP